MITPLPRWAMVAILIAVVALCAAPAVSDQLLLYCVGWPLKMFGQLVLKLGWALLTLFVFICLIRFGYRKLVVK
ncbi:MAG: hypothetical protein AAB911_02240 [Patescibacteria group bacterium]